MPLPIVIVAVAFILMGIYALINPLSFVSLFDGAADNVNARNEVRAVYGGFGVCLGALLLSASSLTPSLASGIYAAAGVALAGMALGRIVSSLIERPGPWPWAFMGVEAIAAWMMFSVVLNQT